MARLTTCLTVRVSKGLRKQFKAKAKNHGDPSEVHREIIEAFVDGRMTIKPKPKMEIKHDD